MIAEEAIATFIELGDTRGLALARFLLAYGHRGAGRHAAAAAELELALVDADASGHAPTRSWVITQLVQMLILGPMPVLDAIRRTEELRESCRGETVLEATIERGLSLLYAMAGRDEDARESDRRASRVLDEVDYHTQAYFRIYAARALLLLGDFDAAERHLLGIWERFGGERNSKASTQTSAAARQLANLYCLESRWDDVERWLQRVEPRVLAPGGQGPMLAAMASLAQHPGQLDEALTLANRAVEAGEQGDAPNWQAEAWQALAEVEHAGGRDAEADAAVAAALDLYERKGNLASAAQLRAKAEAGFRPASVPLGPTP